MFTSYKHKNIKKEPTIYEMEQLKLSNSNIFLIWSFAELYEICTFLLSNWVTNGLVFIKFVWLMDILYYIKYQ